MREVLHKFNRWLLLTATLIGGSSAYSSHIAGGYLTYSCLGNQQYRIQFYFYRDCSGAPAPGSANIAIRDNGGVILGQRVLPLVSTDTLSEVQVNDPCMVPPTNVCVIEYYYYLDTTLPYAPGGIVMYWQGSARNTTMNVSTGDATFPAEQPDTAVFGCNSAPQFIQPPPVFICNMDSLTYDLSALDPDGDSLVYKLCSAYGTGWPPALANYLLPYTPANPMPASPALVVNPLTGFVSGFPTQSGKFVIGLCIDEYRNGTVIANYYREFQFNVVDCYPGDAHIDGTLNDYDTIKECDFFTVYFSNASSGLYHHWDFGTGNPGDTSNQEETWFSYSDTGVYLVTLIAGNGICTDTAYAYVSVYPIIAYPNWTTWPCLNEPIQFVSIVSGTAPAAYYWNFNNEGSSTLANPTFTWSTMGVKWIYLTVWNNHGCSNTTSDYLYMLQLPSITLTPDTTLCKGDSIQLLAQSSGGGTFTWSPSTGLSNPNIPNPMASPSATTTYTVSLDSTVACANEVTVTIEVVDKPTVTVSADTIICPGDVAQLNSIASDTSGIASWKWVPAAGLSNDAIPNPIADPPVPIVYTLTVTNAYGCTASDAVAVIRDLPMVNAGPSQQICFGDSVQLVATSGSNPVSWQWSPANLVTDPTSPSTTAKPLSTTSFVITMTNNLGCVATDATQVTVHPLPPVDAGADVAICLGDNAQLQATGAFSYAWNPNPILSCMFCDDPVAQNPLSTQTFFVTGTDLNGCENMDSVQVTVNTLPLVSVTNDTFVCAGSNVQLHATGPLGSQFQWTGPPGLSCMFCPDPIATPFANSVWTVTVTDPNGCEGTATVAVDVRPLPSVVASPDVTICELASTTLSATGASTYVWQPGALSGSPLNVSPTTPTTYTVTGMDAWGCTDTDVVTVTVNPLPPVDAGPDQSICLGSSATLTASGANTYLWQPGSMNGASVAVSPVDTTTYTVIGTDLVGCVNTDDATVWVHMLPTVSAMASDKDICAGDVITLSATGAQSYVWVPGGSGSTITQSPGSSTTYIVTGTDVHGCQDTGSVLVLVHPTPAVTAGPDDHICVGETTTLTASGALNYIWQPSGQTTNSITVSPLSTTTYVVTGADGFGCTATDTAQVTVHSLPNVSAGPDAAICYGESATLNASGAVNYVWSNGVTGVVNVVSPVSLTTYTVTGIDIYGCSNDDDVDVGVNPLPTVTATSDTICRGQSGLLYASGALVYLWQPAGIIGNPGVFSPVATTIYTVTGTDANGCSSATTAMLLVHQLPLVSAGLDQAICVGDTAQLGASGALQFSWQPTNVSDPNIPDPVTAPTTTTTYIVTGTDANGCSNTDAVEVIVNPLPPITALDDQWLYAGGCTKLTATGGATYSWSPPTFLNDPTAQEPISCPNDTVTYYVTGIDANGCVNIDSVIIYAYAVPEPNIPTAFTPDGNGLNDVFRLESPEHFTMRSFTIFNRWGEVIFETTDPLAGWDGTFMGQPQPIGTYVFRVVGVDDIGYRVVRQGNVTLVR